MNYDEYYKLLCLYRSIEELEGVMIPYNIIKNNIKPLEIWLKKELDKKTTLTCPRNNE